MTEYKIGLYRIARNGISTGAVVGLGKVPKYWAPEIIKKLVEKINNNNVPVYAGHSPNPRTPRNSIGHIHHAFVYEVTPIQTDAIVIVIFMDGHDPKQLDVASIEADLTIEWDIDKFKVIEIETVSGLALANSDDSTPGFSCSKLMAAVIENKQTQKQQPDLECGDSSPQ